MLANELRFAKTIVADFDKKVSSDRPKDKYSTENMNRNMFKMFITGTKENNPVIHKSSGSHTKKHSVYSEIYDLRKVNKTRPPKPESAPVRDKSKSYGNAKCSCRERL